MLKWLGGLIDSNEKEMGRLRGIVAQVNQQIVELLTDELDDLRELRAEVAEVLARSVPRDRLAGVLDTAIHEASAENLRLAAAGAENRRMIEDGEAATRQLNVLMADARQLEQLKADLDARRGDRAELENNVGELIERVQEQLVELATNYPAMAPVIERLPGMTGKGGRRGRLTADEVQRLVASTSETMEPIVSAYFHRLQDLLIALRHTTALLTLLGSQSPAMGAAEGQARPPHPLGGKEPGDLRDLRASARTLVDSLASNDLMKHLQRQGLLLPAELQAAPSSGPATQTQARGGGLFGRRAPAGTPQTVQLRRPADDLADLLTWEEGAMAALLDAVEQVVPEAEQPALESIRTHFGAREERLQGRMAAARGRLLANRTEAWQEFDNRLVAEFGEDMVSPFLEPLAVLDGQQGSVLAALQAQEEAGGQPPIQVKPMELGELMQRREAAEALLFRQLDSALHVADGDDRSRVDRLRAMQEEYRAANRKSEEALLNELLPTAFACVWEAGRRTIGLRAADVQFMGGTVMHEGKIAEMKTGEGKTLVATLPLVLNALSARGAHLCTVNEYLVSRDSDWMGPIYLLLGLTVGTILANMDTAQRKAEYMSDITYGTTSEFGFDYLRDNTTTVSDYLAQRDPYFCVVDEVDNILIDEARTPLIISGPAQESNRIHERCAIVARTLVRDVDYTVDEKQRVAIFTEEGVTKVEHALGVDNLYHPDNFTLVYGMDNALKARAIFKRDKDYVLVQDKKVILSGEKLNPKLAVEVVIVDENTGRQMEGRRYSEGLHEAIEAKEGIRVRGESMTLATITIQNYFRMYPKLSGMTGTALTEAEEFYKIYKLEATPIPTRLPMVRVDHSDRVYKNEKSKFNAVVEEIKEEVAKGRPVLVGTVSIEKSEELARALEAAGITHTILNAKYHEREASIIAQAGQRGAVTIATNMAGRGTDIQLGFGVAELGGLHIIGTERHESRRIDNQLRGRSGRQGDPGSSRFYVSLEDEIMRRSGVNQNVVNSRWFNAMWDDSMPIEYNLASKSVEQAQVKMEGFNFDLRKHLVEYDDVVNTQRDVIYRERRYILTQGEPRTIVLDMLAETVQELADPSTVAMDADGRRTTRSGGGRKTVPNVETFFKEIADTFPRDVVRKLVKRILTDHLAPLIENGNRARLADELGHILEESYSDYRQGFLDRVEEILRAFFHVNEDMYENVERQLDYRTLLMRLGELMSVSALTPADVEGIDYDGARILFLEGMEGEDGEVFKGAIEQFDDFFEPQYTRLQEDLAAAAGAGDARARLEAAQRTTRGAVVEREGPAKEPADDEAEALLDLIDSQFPLASPSAGARATDDPALAGRVVIEHLLAIYNEMELGLSRDFLDQNAPHKLVSLVGPVVPTFVYRQIEEELGTERLEAEEVKPLLDADPEVREVVGTAYAKHHEAHWILSMIDNLWTRHLTTMEELRHGINLQALAQRDPLVEYKRQSFNLFDDLKRQMRTSIVNNVMSIHLRELDAREQRALKKATRTVLTKQTSAMRAQAPARPAAKATAHDGNGNGSHADGNGTRDGATNGAESDTPTPAGVGGASRPTHSSTTPPRGQRPAQIPPRSQRGKPPRGKR